MHAKYPTTLQISILFPERIWSASWSRMQAIDWCCRETFRLIIQNHFHIPSISLFVLFSPFIRQTHFKLSTNRTARIHRHTALQRIERNGCCTVGSRVTRRPWLVQCDCTCRLRCLPFSVVAICRMYDAVYPTISHFYEWLCHLCSILLSRYFKCARAVCAYRNNQPCQFVKRCRRFDFVQFSFLLGFEYNISFWRQMRMADGVSNVNLTSTMIQRETAINKPMCVCVADEN